MRYRAELLVVLGMCLSIGSLYLPWTAGTAMPAGASGLPALYSNAAVRDLNGFAAGVWLPITLSSVLCAAAQLWRRTEKTDKPAQLLQSIGAAVCAVECLLHLSPKYGVLLGLTGAVALFLGTIDR